MRKITIVLCLVVAGFLCWAMPAYAQEPDPHLGYGMLLGYPADPEHMNKVTAADFDWYKYFARWDDVDPDRDGVYNWETVKWWLDTACQRQLNLLLRVERASNNWQPIQDGEMAGWQAFFRAMAEYVGQQRATCDNRYRVAFEVWNEPNLDFQWTGQSLDAARYTEMVRRAYLGAKAGDPDSIIVAGGLAPTGGDGVHAINDVTYLEAMYAAGLQGHFDAISIHNYGFGGPPEDKEYGGGVNNFRRAEDIYAVMAAHGDEHKPVWATEFGWLLDSDEEGVACDPDWESWGFAWQQVGAITQSTYLTRAFAYANANWPWMQVMVVSDLDFATLPSEWMAACDPLRWFSVLKPDGSPRLAYTGLQEMPKKHRSWASQGMYVGIGVLDWITRLRDRALFTTTVTVENTGERPFTWTLTTASQGLPFTVTPTTGDAGESFQIVVDARGLLTGTYTGIVTVTAAADFMPHNPLTIPLTLNVVAIGEMEVRPAALSWMMAVSDTRPAAATVVVENTGDYPFDWSVITATHGITFSVVPTTSVWGEGTLQHLSAFKVTVDPRGLPTGDYTGVITLTTTAPMLQSPFAVPLHVRIVARLYPVYLPLVLRNAP
ncbi:MAG: hypothetical protein JXA21_22070 [Anaerolineae bacterium]|nr:hypothetical protein [Anaerolineae bacterium]